MHPHCTQTTRMKMTLLIQHICIFKSNEIKSKVTEMTVHSPSPSEMLASACLGCELPAELMCLSKSSSLIFPFLSFFSRRVSSKSSFKSSWSTSDSCDPTNISLRLFRIAHSLHLQLFTEFPIVIHELSIFSKNMQYV